MKDFEDLLVPILLMMALGALFNTPGHAAPAIHCVQSCAITTTSGTTDPVRFHTVLRDGANLRINGVC